MPPSPNTADGMSSRHNSSPSFSNASSSSSDARTSSSYEEKSPPPDLFKLKLLSEPPAGRALDCWSEAATQILIDAWGSKYLELNRGNLRQHHWQFVADTVNASTGNPRRTDIQCKNRIDTVKKKYKIEKSKTLKSRGRYVSYWTHFNSLDSLLGDSFSKSKYVKNTTRNNLRRRVRYSPESSPEPSPPATRMHEKIASLSHPVGLRSKRSGFSSVTKRNFSVMAAAAAAMEEDDDVGGWCDQLGKKRKMVHGEERCGCGKLAEAILKLGSMYEKVELGKQKQMVELEKQRMQFAKDLEIQRMKVFMESQIQLERLKRSPPKRNSEISL